MLMIEQPLLLSSLTGAGNLDFRFGNVPRGRIRYMSGQSEVIREH
jgi:hypothetical protein